MKRAILFVICCLPILMNLSGCASFSPSSGVQLAHYRDHVLKNGLKVIVVEDHSLPYVSLGLLVRSGAAQDPLSKSGLAEMTAQIIERGTKKHSATEIADAFGNLGTSFGSDADYDFSYFSTSGLSASQDELFNLFFEVTTEPAFSISEVNRIKAEMIADVKRGYDHPPYVAGRLFEQLLYGTHPYGRSTGGTVRDLQGIKQKDLIRFYLKSYRPNNSILVLVGDLKKDIVPWLNERLKDWQPRPTENEKYPPQEPLQGIRLQLADRPDLQQTEIRIGHYGVKRKIDDYQALILADSILSGGFTSRLMKEIRVKRGLTYGISSTFDAREDAGPFTVATNTRHEKVGEVIAETLNVMRDFVEKGVTEEEVENAKGYLRGIFPRRIETPDQLARMLIALRFYNIEDSYLTDYVRNLNKISASDVNKVIKRYYHPQNVRVLIYGPRGKIIEQLRPIGTVEVKNYRQLL